MSGVNCREYEMDLMDLARRRPLDAATRGSLAAHLESCARCRHVLDSQLQLSAAAGVVADEASRWNAPFRVEQALSAELRAGAAPRRRRYLYGLAGAAIAASLMIAWMVSRPALKPEIAKTVPAPVATQQVATVIPPTPAAVRKVIHRKAAPAVAEAAEHPFIAIPYTAPLEPYERADVVRMNLPVTALIAAGVPVDVTDAGARAQTDVLVGQDGRARAVRLVSISMANFNNGQSGVNAQ